MEQEKVLCIRTSDNQNVPITRVAAVYLFVDEDHPGYIAIKAGVSDNDETAFRRFNPNELEKGLWTRWENEIYDETISNVIITYLNCKVELEEKLGKEWFEKYMKTNSGSGQEWKHLMGKAKAIMTELATPVIQKYANNIYAHLPKVADVIDIEI